MKQPDSELAAYKAWEGGSEGEEIRVRSHRISHASNDRISTNSIPQAEVRPNIG